MYNIENKEKISNKDWKIIQNLPLTTLQPLILGKKIEMVAECGLFPNFHVKGLGYKIEQKTSNACLIHIKQNKTGIRVDGGMNKLQYRCY